MEELSIEQLNRATLARQMLLAREEQAIPEAVERLGALQAQEPRPPFVALHARLAGFERQHLADALHAGTVVRAMAMRATLHILSRNDYVAFRAALDPVMTGAMAALRGRDQGLDLETLLPAARELLEDDPLTFNEIRARLQEQFPDVNERALGYATRLHLPLTMVPTEDPWAFPRDSRFGLGPEPHKQPDLEALARRYLGAFGPATAADFQTWSGLKNAKPLFESLDLATFRFGRKTLYDLPDAPRPEPAEPPPPRLLPDFDSLLLAHQDRTRIVDDEHRKQLTTKNLRIKATFLVDGRVAGSWSANNKELTLEPFGRIPKHARPALEEEAEALARFLGGKLQLSGI